jgi:GT2 family glycosyltransferase
MMDDKEARFQRIQATRTWKVLRYFRRRIVPDGSRRAMFVALTQNSLQILKSEGMSGILWRAVYYATGKDYFKYKIWIKKNEIWDVNNIRREIAEFPYKPVISILVPTYNTEPKWLDRCIQSVTTQIYDRWELCIYDDASSNTATRECLQKWQASHPNIKVELGKDNLHIAGATNRALKLATGEFIALLDHDDELSPQALYLVVKTINKHPELDLLYSDEDKLDPKGNRTAPYFKPDWNPDLLQSQNYINHLSVYRASIVRELGGFREGVDGAQDWDLAFRVTESIPVSHIYHIPYVLYHWRIISGSSSMSKHEKQYAVDAQHKAIEDHLSRTAANADVQWLGQYWRIKYRIPEPTPLVSLIMPTRDGYELIRRCVESIYEKTSYRKFELIIVDNGSTEERVLQYFDLLAREKRARVIKYSKPFNYSAINNFAVGQAQGQIIGLINNDLEVITEEWLEEMVSHVVRPEIGAVGAKLLYPDNTLQHAGTILGLGGVAGHWFKRFPNGYAAQFNRPNLVQNLSAVTAACLLVRRSIYESVGGLDENELKVAFNDVDFCIKVRQNGYRNLYTPFAVLYHHESASRGLDNTPEKRARFAHEISVMKQRWGEHLSYDPAYNPNLTQDKEDAGLSFRTRAQIR